MARYWRRPNFVSSWRKISVGMWSAPKSPAIFGSELVDFTETLAYLDEVTKHSGQKVTLTVFVVKALATILKSYPELNSIIIGNRVLTRENVDVFVQVAIANEEAEKADLSGVKLRQCDQLDFISIAKKLSSRAQDVRTGQDKELQQTKSMVDKVPPALMPYMVKLVDFLTYNVPVELDALGIRSDPFGSVMVTNVGQFDIRHGFAPLVPASRCPFIVLLTAVHDAPFVVDGKVKVRKCAYLSFTMDHRVYDGYQIGIIVRLLREMIANPRDHFPAPEHWGTFSADDGSNSERKPPKKRTPEVKAR